MKTVHNVHCFECKQGYTQAGPRPEICGACSSPRIGVYTEDLSLVAVSFPFGQRSYSEREYLAMVRKAEEHGVSARCEYNHADCALVPGGRCANEIAETLR